jgi:hypothetical protein
MRGILNVTPMFARPSVFRHTQIFAVQNFGFSQVLLHVQLAGGWWADPISFKQLSPTYSPARSHNLAVDRITGPT